MPPRPDTARTRYTDLFFTVDTHVKPNDADDEQRLARALVEAVDAFVTPAVLRAVLPCDDARKLRGATLTPWVPEVGSKFGRIHCHFNLSLRHETKIYLKHPRDGRTINEQVQQWFDERLEPVTGRKCFARVSLADSGRAKNYAVKHGQAVDDFTVAGAPAQDGPRTG